jgi:asparagine synthase (glutamine-hydrolysing)
MPGLAGIIGTGLYEENTSALYQMVKCMAYQPFYNSGSYVNEQLGLWIGWVGHAGSFSDCMPVWNETNEICLIFSGEDFMDPQEIECLKARGHHCDGENGSYLLHLYEEIGLKFIEKLNGWFSGVLVDLRKQNIIMFNDRYGIDRLFIHEGKNRLFFSSEAKALLSVLPWVKEFDLKGVGEFLTCGCTLGYRSLYKGIDILPSGSLLRFVNGEVERRDSYFKPKCWNDQECIGEEEFVPQTVALFGNLVQRYSGGTLPVGVSLTGGLDSRMVMACLDKRPGEFPCYTFASMYRDTFDVQVAREVAKACDQSYYALTLGEDFLDDFPNYLEKAVYISDGYIGLSGAAELFGNSLARSIAPVRLTGNYGGELLRGDRAFNSRFPKGGFINADFQPYLVEAQKTFQELEKTDPLTFALFHQAPCQGYGRRAIEKSQVILRTPFMDNDLVKLAYQAPAAVLKGDELSMKIIAWYNPDLLKIPTDRGLIGDGASIMNRARQFQRKAFKKAEYWSSHGMPNWLAAISHFGLSGILEKSFLGRDKFQHFRLWTQKTFPEYITDVLLQGTENLKEFFERGHIERMVREHIAGRQNYTDEIDKLMTLTLTYRTLLKGVFF